MKGVNLVKESFAVIHVQQPAREDSFVLPGQLLVKGLFVGRILSPGLRQPIDIAQQTVSWHSILSKHHEHPPLYSSRIAKNHYKPKERPSVTSSKSKAGLPAKHMWQIPTQGFLLLLALATRRYERQSLPEVAWC